MAKWMLFAALLLGALPAATQADYCLGAPRSVKDKSCAGPVGCPPLEYCGPEAVCVPRKGLGATCDSSAECPAFSTCYKGDEEDVSKCVKLASPGEACVVSGEPASAGNQCGSGLSCSLTTNTCRSGRYGDSCKADDDCSNGKCTGGTCSGQPAGGDCTSSSQCQRGLTCNEESKCAARKTNGSPCDFSSECSSDICTRIAPEANTTCVGHASIAGGSYSENRRACVTGMLYNNYCLDGPSEYCTTSSGCGRDLACMCGGDYLLSGFGTCRKDDCFNFQKALDECIEKNCESDTISYEGACALRSCSQAVEDYYTECVLYRRFMIDT